MKIIPASFEILDELDRQSLAVRIEACGRVCYKSEDKITPDSAGPFVKKIIKHGHNSVTEMAVFTLKISKTNEEDLNRFYAILPKYLFVDRREDYLLITGSVRAFREVCANRDNQNLLILAITDFLVKRHPLLYEDLGSNDLSADRRGISVEKLRLEKVEKLPPELLARHRHLAVKFYVNRAVTHEIVRHRPCSYLQESQRYCRYDESKFGNEVTFIKPLFFEEDSEEYRLWETAMRQTEKIYLKLLETSSPQAARTVLPNSCKTELIAYANLVEWRHIFKLRTSKAAEPSMREVMIPLLKRCQERFPAVFTGIQTD